MGNYRFRLSDMMPNAWFYKLKELGKSRNHHNTKKKQATTTTMLSASTTQQPAQIKPTNLSQYPRKSYYFTRELIPCEDKCYNSPTKPKSTEKIIHFPDPPRKSSKQRRNRRRNNRSTAPRLVNSSVSAGCSCRATIWTKSESPTDYSPSSSPSSSSETDTSPNLEVEEDCVPKYRSERVLVTESFDKMVAWSRSCESKVNSVTAKDIFEDKKSLDKRCAVKPDGFEGLSDFELPRIITKPANLEDEEKKEINEPTHYRIGHGLLSVKIVKEDKIGTREHKKFSPVRKSSVSSPGVRLRMNSPRIASRKIQAHGRRSTSSSSSSSSRRSNLSDSFAIVKSSFDPQRDFRESMVEMIVENNIKASKDLEDLLACYLSLNSDEYHELIIKVFKEIWFDLTDIKQKK